MFDLVPLRCPRRVVAHLQYQSDLIGQFPQFELPQPHARSVRTTAVSGDQQPARRVVTNATNDLIPATVELTANAAVSWSIPTLIQPAFAARS
jgi:hypothetical protein